MLVVPDVFLDIVTDTCNDLKATVSFAKLTLVVVVAVLEERISVNLYFRSLLPCFGFFIKSVRCGTVLD